MLKNITLSADMRLIDAARDRVRREHTTLNAEFRRWLARYAQGAQQIQEFDTLMQDLRGKLVCGRKFTREEMNER
jgi:hypothetical protein